MGTRARADTVIEGKYRLERELGSGGMGSVWLATQLMVDRPVAVKLLHPAFIDQEELQARFEVEAKAIGRLNHPNCITLYDFGFSDGLEAFYTVIEYIDGDSLDNRLGMNMPLSEAVSIVKQIAMALAHAHHQGILHRDLKPENVMLAEMTDGSEIVKVLDFGIARIVKGEAKEDAERITKAGEVFGTPAYMSPEQARSIRQLKPSADLYSLGVIFYELVSGKLPFFSKSAFDLLMLHVTQPVPRLDRPDLPQEVEDIIYRLLEKEPEARFQSGKELVEALDALEIPEDAEVGHTGDFDSEPTRVTSPPMALDPSSEFQTPADLTNSAEFPAAASGEFGAIDASQSGQFPAGSPDPGQAHQTTMLGGAGATGEFNFEKQDQKRKLAVLAIAGGLVLAVGLTFVILMFSWDEDATARSSPDSADTPSAAADSPARLEAESTLTAAEANAEVTDPADESDEAEPKTTPEESTQTARDHAEDRGETADSDPKEGSSAPTAEAKEPQKTKKTTKTEKTTKKKKRRKKHRPRPTKKRPRPTPDTESETDEVEKLNLMPGPDDEEDSRAPKLSL